jgi:hypothetical protein
MDTRRSCEMSEVAGLCWCSTDQGSVSTSSAESEIKAVNHTLRSEVCADRYILNAMGWKQSPTVIEEDNAACVACASTPHITRNMRHIELAHYFLRRRQLMEPVLLPKLEQKIIIRISELNVFLFHYSSL